MYERFTDRARKVMQFANQEAQRFRHEYVGTEHILLGLVKEGSGVAANVLKNLDLDLRTIRREVERIVQPGPSDEPSITGRLPQTPRAKKVIEYAIEEARGLNHNYVGTEHLLLGLVREGEGVAAQVLMSLGLKLEDVREEVMNLLGRNLPTPPVGPLTEQPQDDVHLIPKSLAPGTVEAYPVSDEPVDEPAGPADLTVAQLQLVLARVRELNEQKEAFAAAQDFARAAKCRDEADALARLLAWYERGRR